MFRANKVKEIELKGQPQNWLLDGVWIGEKLVCLGVTNKADNAGFGKGIFILHQNKAVQIDLPEPCYHLVPLTDNLLLCTYPKHGFIIDLIQEKIINKLNFCENFKNNICVLRKSNAEVMLVCGGQSHIFIYTYEGTAELSLRGKIPLIDKTISNLCASSVSTTDFMVAFSDGKYVKYSITPNVQPVTLLDLAIYPRQRWVKHISEPIIAARPSGGYVAAEEILGSIFVLDEAGTIVAESHHLHLQYDLFSKTHNRIEKLYLLSDGETDTLFVTFANSEDVDKIAVSKYPTNLAKDFKLQFEFFRVGKDIKELFFNQATGQCMALVELREFKTQIREIDFPPLEHIKQRTSVLSRSLMLFGMSNKIVDVVDQYLRPRL